MIAMSVYFMGDPGPGAHHWARNGKQSLTTGGIAFNARVKRYLKYETIVPIWKGRGGVPAFAKRRFRNGQKPFLAVVSA
jgi:hypothetical protein